jgi:hypothetical protein
MMLPPELHSSLATDQVAVALESLFLVVALEQWMGATELESDYLVARLVVGVRPAA